MELDDLKAGWKDLDRRLAYMEARLITARATAGVRRELRPLVAGQVLQAVLGVALAMGAGSFWFEHRGNLNLMVTGLFLHLYAISMIVAAARNLFLVQRIDEGAPVLALQHRLAALRAWRIREGRWFGAVGCFAWVALVIWGFGLLGVDIVAARPLFLGCLLLTASICLAVFVLMARLDKAPEGSAMRRAAERLEEIRRFESGVETP